MIEREGKRIGERRCRAFSARPLVAGVLALFVILQGLTAIGSAIARSAHGNGETSFVVSLLGVTCAVDAHSGDDKSPMHERGHAQCCALCGARGFDGAALPALAQVGEAIFPLRVSVSKERHFADAPTQHPIGWARSWSAQAPPIFS